ncbi:hypothetical protein [Albidovulum sp.]
MIHFATAAASPAERVQLASGQDGLGFVVQRQVRLLAAEGFGGFDIRWNRVQLTIEARSETALLRRDFDPSGRLVSERIIEGKVGVRRRYCPLGLAVISEEILEIGEDR